MPKWRLTLFLVPPAPGKPARKFDFDPIVPRGMEWVGLDGRGRGYARVDLA
jgi:hypothetical protein